MFSAILISPSGGYRQNICYANEGYIHISIDDVSLCLRNLLTYQYASIWDEPLFGFLYLLHNEYHAKFSLYIFLNDRWDLIKEQHKKELNTASNWLKFGLHSRDFSFSYTNTKYDDTKKDWNSFVKKVLSFTDNTNSIDRFPRLHNYSGSRESLCGMRDANYGPIGFLTADSDRPSYYLEHEIGDCEFYSDKDSDLCFKKTNMRGDWFTPRFSSEYNYKSPEHYSIYQELVLRNYKNIEWFCHEWQLYKKDKLNYKKMWLLDVCYYAAQYGIPFEFPETIYLQIKSKNKL